METLSETQDDSSGANPSSVKSEDGSPPPDGDRGSPPPNCAICLGRCRNKSFTDSCLHQFCFKCLVTWSRVKTECPLCKQNFKAIIHNVQSNHQYEEYRVEQRRQEEDRIDIDDLVTATRRFRYRTTLTFPRGREHIALQRLLLHYPPLSAMVGMSHDLPGITPAALPASRRRRSPSSFRRTVYRHNLWARPLPDFTGRYRDCTPEFYRYNDSQMHRLVPWLNRELHYLLLENAGHIAYVLQRILELLPQYHITSPEFREEMFRYFGSRTEHFLHELHCFASTPYDITGYDRSVQYTTDSRISNTVNEVSSSDTESGDSDIVEVLVTPPQHRAHSTPPVSFRPVSPILPSRYLPNPGPSTRRVPDPVYPLNLITSPMEAARLARDVVPIETISHSDTDDDEVMVTGYIKPPHQRTPEVVDLRDSDDDSDVVVTETPAVQSRYGHGPVKLTLTRPRALSPSDSDESFVPSRNLRSRDRNSSSDSPSSQCSLLASPRTPTTQRTDSDFSEGMIALQREGDMALRKQKDRSYPVERSRTRRSRLSRDAERESGVATASMARTSPVAGSSSDRSSSERRETDKRKKCKSSNGKGVKSSRRDVATESMRSESMEVDEPQAGPSSRAAGKAVKSSRKHDATEATRRAESSTEAQEEPRPGPSFRPDGKEVKSSRSDDTTESRKPESATVREKSYHGPSSRPGKGVKSSRRVESIETRRAESIPVQEETYPGPSSQLGKGVKSSRRVESTETRRAESTVQEETYTEPSSRLGKGVKSSRRDESTETRSAEFTVLDESYPEPSSQPEKEVQSFIRDESTETRRAKSTVQEETYPGPSSRQEKGEKASRMDESTETKRAESKVQEDTCPGPSSRPEKNEKASRRDESTETRRAESTVQEETYPGPSSRQEKAEKASRRHESTETRRAESTGQEETYPGPSSRPEKGGKTSRRDECTETRRAESTVQEDTCPGPSSRPEQKVKSSRRDESTETRRAESTSVQEDTYYVSSSRLRMRVKLSRRHQSTETRRAESALVKEEPRGRKGGKSTRKDDTAATSRRDESMTEALPGSSSRAGTSSLKRKNAEIPARRKSCERKRLKSVVKKATESRSSNVGNLSSGVRTLSSTVRVLSSVVSSPSSTSSSSSKARSKRRSSSTDNDARTPRSPDFFTDSDDDIPLNLTIQKSARLS